MNVMEFWMMYGFIYYFIAFLLSKLILISSFAAITVSNYLPTEPRLRIVLLGSFVLSMLLVSNMTNAALNILLFEALLIASFLPLLLVFIFVSVPLMLVYLLYKLVMISIKLAVVCVPIYFASKFFLRIINK